MDEKKAEPAILLIDNQGLSHYTSYLALGISKYQQVILYGFSSNSNDYDITGASKKKKIELHPLEKKLPQRNSFLKIIGRSLLLFLIFARELYIKNYDIVHVQERLPLFFLLIPLLKIKQKKFIWTIHDINLLPLSGGLRGKLEMLYRNLISQPYLLAKYADAIIVHAHSLKESLIAKKVNQNKIYVIPHFDYKYLLRHNENKDAEQRYNDGELDDSHSYVLFFGDIMPWKGVDVLLDAAKIVRSKTGSNKFKLVIAGRSYHGHTDIMKQVGSDCDFIKRINKFVTGLEISDLLSAADFVVLPYNISFQYSASGVLPLAYTFAKPVIASNIPSITEYVEHEKTGFIFESGNSAQLALYMMELIKDKQKCIRMGKAAYQKLVNEMSLESSCNKLNEVYNEILK
jgi:alpha-maltose-1-phosphate synthase